jgi:hypothetical protein
MDSWIVGVCVIFDDDRCDLVRGAIEADHNPRKWEAR